jgi:hypothetical protein
MINQVFPRVDVNPVALDESLRDALGDAITGISTGPHGVVVHFVAEPTAPQLDTVAQIIAAHDPESLSPSQLAAQYRDAVQSGAQAQAAAIPSFAFWTEQRGLDWIANHIGPARIDGITNLAEAKAVMNDQTIAFEALWRMIVAMRNQLWPNLQETE